jgi:hypothetical protein
MPLGIRGLLQPEKRETYSPAEQVFLLFTSLRGNDIASNPFPPASWDSKYRGLGLLAATILARRSLIHST